MIHSALLERSEHRVQPPPTYNRPRMSLTSATPSTCDDGGTFIYAETSQPQSRATTRARRASQYEVPRSDDHLEDRRRHSIEVSVQPPPSTQPSKGAGFLSGLFPKKKKKMTTGHVFSMFRKPSELYFPPISPRSSLAHAGRLPMETLVMSEEACTAERYDGSSQRKSSDTSDQRVILGSSRRQTLTHLQTHRNSEIECGAMEPPNSQAIPRSTSPRSQGASSRKDSGHTRIHTTPSDPVVGGNSPRTIDERCSTYGVDGTLQHIDSNGPQPQT
ncbi:hypothetical protein AaE_004365 [Aphanomyces astaci]|uniref:Uncharacterized protein n=1 Tax=Aphanomyces astaci TaxID=112090 RepID=A0A6A5AP93_APHAT|nr:hypothetical protein AaE_004365 [Aphanomyces astaci]